MTNHLPKLNSLMLAVALSLSTILAVNAQNRPILGTVLDANLGDTVAGATVMVKDTARGRADDQVLVISFMGYCSQEIEIGSQSTMTINLEEDIQSLEEAVVIGYRSQDKKEIIPAVVGVSPEEINKVNIHNPAQLL